MPFTLKEPIFSKYIYINQATNQVHLLVPIVGGQEISTDNTCQATKMLKEFFDGEALHALIAYKDALLFDIALLEEGDLQRAKKEARLGQIKIYIEAVSAMKYTYADAITAFLRRSSNLYSIQLRPREQDSESKVINPTFSIERRNNSAGIPLSPLYRAIHSIFHDITIGIQDPRARLTNTILGKLPAAWTFIDIQRHLRDECQNLFDLSIDFTKQSNGVLITKDMIDELMGFADNATAQDYVDALLGACALNIWATISSPPFYSIPIAASVSEKTERLSILTQFFLANLNIYCKAKGISTQNFGIVLDNSAALSEYLVILIAIGLHHGHDIETIFFTFCNEHAATFKLSRPLDNNDLIAVKKQFERHYRMVTSDEKHVPMDDFMILDLEAIDPTALCTTHQGAITVNFAEIVNATLPNQHYFATVREDFAAHPSQLPHQNKEIAATVDLEPEELRARLTAAQWEQLPAPIKEAGQANPTKSSFPHEAAHGKQEEAEALLTAASAPIQTILKTAAVFTDGAGRTFHCTAYEYAYWAKDTHMRHMLEHYMDADTKRHMLELIDNIEHEGLTYQQNGIMHQSAHFDLNPLQQALTRYVRAALHAVKNEINLHKLWIDVGKHQHDLPTHIIQEYCRVDRSFIPKPHFHEEHLPRTCLFYNSKTASQDFCFSQNAPHKELGVTFALIRSGGRMCHGTPKRPLGKEAAIDLEAIKQLDKTKTDDLASSRSYLNSPINILRMN